MANRSNVGIADIPGVYFYSYLTNIVPLTVPPQPLAFTSTPVKIVVKNQQPAKVGSVVNKVVPIGKVFSFNFNSNSYFSDPEAGKLQYQYKLISGEGVPDWFRVTLANSTITGFPSKLSNFTVEIKAIDPTENYNTQTFQFTVVNEDLRVNEV